MRNLAILTMGGSVLRNLKESPVSMVDGEYIIDHEKVKKMVKFLEEIEHDNNN